MGDIGARQVRYEVLPTSTPSERVEARVESVTVRDETAQHERRAARAEPARG